MTVLADSAPVAIYHADLTGRLTYANAMYRALFGLASGQDLDDWAHAVHPEDRVRMQAAWTDFCRRPRAMHFQWRAKLPTSGLRHLTEDVVPMGAGLEGFVGTITDVTELKKAQAQVELLQREAGPDEQRLALERDLRTALMFDQLELHYQPKLDTRTNAINGAEALVRWRHPQRGLLTPADFVPFAEESGLIAEIGDWVIQEACRQIQAWQAEGLAPIRVAVNLSPSQFRHGDLLTTMREALDEAALDPRFLEVELTESTVMSDVEGSAAILERLSQMGVLVSVDDFGTGYSSISYLRRFPVDKLKIDRTFISEITSRPDDALIVRAIVSLAHSLKLKVVAEGVETREQLEFLKALGCDQYQGFYFSPALPATEFAALLHKTAQDRATFMDSVASRTHSKLSTYQR